MDASQGVIASPNYPNSYPADQNCEWVVQVATGRTIEVVFNSSFNVVGSVGDCSGDYLLVSRFHCSNLSSKIFLVTMSFDLKMFLL